MKNWNETFRSLNVGLPDDVERLKAAGYYQEAIERIDAYLAEDWTETQNSPRSQGAEPVGEELPQNPTPHGVEALRDAMLAQREMMRRIPAEYCYTEDEAVARMQGMVRDFTREEFRLLVKEGRVDWRFVEGEKHYLDRFAETLLATHADLAARQIDPPAPGTSAREFRNRQHEQMERDGQASARITLKTSVGMSDEAFAAALAGAKAEGRNSVHVRAWLPIPAACLSQSEIELLDCTEPPARIADENAPQRTVFWEADLTENRRFGVEYRYRTTAVYTDPMDIRPDAQQPTFDTGEEAPHIVFTPYLRALAHQLTDGITDPAEKANASTIHVTLNRALPLSARLLRAGVSARPVRPEPPGRLRHHGADLHHPLPSGGHPGPVAEWPVRLAHRCGLPRLGYVLHRAQGLDVCGLLVRRVDGAAGR